MSCVDVMHAFRVRRPRCFRSVGFPQVDATLWRLAGSIAVLMLGVSGCTPIRVDQMVAVSTAPAPRTSPLAGAVAVGMVSGGVTSTLNGAPLGVSDDQLREALRLSLAPAGYLASGDPSSQFMLEPVVVWFEPPNGGNFIDPTTATPLIRYRLVRRADGAAVFEDLVITPCEVPQSAVWAPAKRMRQAVECAVQRNIGTLLSELSQVSVSEGRP